MVKKKTLIILMSLILQFNFAKSQTNDSITFIYKIANNLDNGSILNIKLNDTIFLKQLYNKKLEHKFNVLANKKYNVNISFANVLVFDTTILNENNAKKINLGNVYLSKLVSDDAALVVAKNYKLGIESNTIRIPKSEISKDVFSYMPQLPNFSKANGSLTYKNTNNINVLIDNVPASVNVLKGLPSILVSKIEMIKEQNGYVTLNVILKKASSYLFHSFNNSITLFNGIGGNINYTNIFSRKKLLLSNNLALTSMTLPNVITNYSRDASNFKQTQNVKSKQDGLFLYTLLSYKLSNKSTIAVANNLNLNNPKSNEEIYNLNNWQNNNNTKITTNALLVNYRYTKSRYNYLVLSGETNYSKFALNNTATSLAKTVAFENTRLTNQHAFSVLRNLQLDKSAKNRLQLSSSVLTRKMSVVNVEKVNNVVQGLNSGQINQTQNTFVNTIGYSHVRELDKLTAKLSYMTLTDKLYGTENQILYALTYRKEIGENNIISFELNSLTERPTLKYLQSFYSNSNLVYINLGNPNLKREITHAAEIDFEHSSSFNLTTTFSLNYKKNGIERVFLKSSNDTVFMKYENISSIFSSNLYIATKIKLNKKLSLKLSATPEYISYGGLSNAYKNNFWRIYSTADLKYKHDKFYAHELNFKYKNKILNVNALTAYQPTLDYTLEKTILKDKGTLFIYVEDIFSTSQKYVQKYKFNNIIETRNSRSKSLSFSVNVFYYFGRMEQGRQTPSAVSNILKDAKQ